ncbi:MAG: hypothetical protein IKF38_04740 [Clostridia bacterium]|nr:hypothetical protein [Clostridia bacterium]
MANITNLIKNIREAIFGKDVRESIASAIEQTYEDAAERGNANMEVVDARGNFDTLKKRLDNNDSTKANKTELESEISSRIRNDNDLENEISLERARIDNIAALPAGSTSGDAELSDIRISYFGSTSQNAGTAVRDQIGKLSKTGSAICYSKRMIKVTVDLNDTIRTYKTKIYKNTLVFYNGTYYELNADQEIIHTDNRNNYIMNLLFDLVNNSFELQRYNLPIPDNYVSVGYVDLRYSNYVKGIVFNNIKQDEKLCGIIIGNYNNKIVEIDSINKTITFPYDTLLVCNENTTSAPYVSLNNDNRICDFSQVNSTAIKIYYDMVNNIFVPLVYSSNSLDKSRYFLVACLRTNAKMASINAPYIFDNLFMGIDINQFVESRKIFNSKINSNVKSINHRGYMNIAPENTIPAFKLSKLHGFDYVETDVRFTSDGIPVLLHDVSINRTARNTDGTEIAETININNITYEDVLTYDFGIFKSPTYAGTKIPRYEDLLALARKIGLKCYIELKAGTQSQIENLVEIAKKYGMLDSITWIGNNNFIPIIKNYYSKARLGLVVADVNSSVIETCANLKTNDNEVFVDAYFNSSTIINISNETIESLIENNIQLEIYDAYESSYINNANPYITGFTTNELVASYELYNANKE